MILGRFNFLTVKQNEFNVLFTPRDGNIISVIAVGLNRSEAVTLMENLNAQLRQEVYSQEGNKEE